MAQRIPIRFDKAYGLLSTVLFMPPSSSYVEVDKGSAQVRMGPSFHACFPLTAVGAMRERTEFTLSRGVHGWAGRWLVNGSGKGLVSIELRPEQGARVLGVPVRLRELIVSVDDPGMLMKALRCKC